MQIHLIRHGKTVATEAKLYYGHTDLPLTDDGIAGIKLLAAQDIYPTADVFYTSGFTRADQTLEIIYGNVPKIIDPRISEYNFGVFEMRSYDELKDNPDYLTWITDDSVKCPQGESRVQFYSRVIEAFADIEANAKQATTSVAAVCHGGVIACIMNHVCPNERNYYEWLPKPGNGYTLKYISGFFSEYTAI